MLFTCFEEEWTLHGRLALVVDRCPSKRKTPFEKKIRSLQEKSSSYGSMDLFSIIQYGFQLSEQKN